MVPDWLIITLFIGGPLVVPATGIWWLTKGARKSDTAKITFYSTSIGGSKILISKKALAIVSLWIVPLVWFDLFFPIPILLFVMLWFIFYLTRRSGRQQVALTNKSTELIKAMQEMRAEIDKTKHHIEELIVEVFSQQNELNEASRLKTSLVSDINDKLKEVKEWQDLSEQQKSLVINAAKEAINNKTSIQIVSIVLGSIVLNLAANVIWSLMGQPGAERIQILFGKFASLFT